MSNEQYPELLADLLEQLTEALKNEGIAVDRARERAFTITEFLRDHWKGAQIYFPGGQQYQLTQRDAQIFDEFNGENWREICLKYDISRGRVYQIVRAMKVSGRQHFLDFGPQHGSEG